MSTLNTMVNELRAAHLSLKEEGKVLRMINAKGNLDHRQARSAGRTSLTPRVLRRSTDNSSPAPQA